MTQQTEDQRDWGCKKQKLKMCENKISSRWYKLKVEWKRGKTKERLNRCDKRGNRMKKEREKNNVELLKFETKVHRRKIELIFFYEKLK